MDLASISDQELRKRLKEAGIDAGPITETTRSTYIRVLQKRQAVKHSGRPVRGPVSGIELDKLKLSSHTPSSSNVLLFPCSLSPLPTPSAKKSALTPSPAPSPVQKVTPLKPKNTCLPAPQRCPGDQDGEEMLSWQPSGTADMVPKGQSSEGMPRKLIDKEDMLPRIPQDKMNWSPVQVVGNPNPGQPLLSPPLGQQSWSKAPAGAKSYDWEIQVRDVEICTRADGSFWLLGKGGFGEVFKGLRNGVDEVAVKVIKLAHPEVVAQFREEVEMISQLRHRNIVQFYGACISPTSLYMVTELMETDLFSALRRDRRYLWVGSYGRPVVQGVALGLHYLHSRRPPVVHRDIKSPNVLLMGGIAKIADVGVARTKASVDMTAQSAFTVAWAAPEVVFRKRATEKIDIWSFGVVLWEVVTGGVPRPGQLVLPSWCSGALRNLYNSCTAEDPAARPSAGKIVQDIELIV